MTNTEIEQLKTQLTISLRNGEFYAKQFKKQLDINHELALENKRLRTLVKINRRKHHDKTL
jgi:regulator of replication initiation timing